MTANLPQKHPARAETTNSPQLILLYTLLAALVFLPRLNTHLNIPVTASLVSHLVISVAFFGTVTYLGIESLYIVYKLFSILLRWLLQPSSGTSFAVYFGTQWRLPASGGDRFWAKLAISVIAAIWLTSKLFFKNAKVGSEDWQAAKSDTAAKREAQKIAAAEQGGEVAEDTDDGPALLWATCAFTYAAAVFDSKEWFQSVLRGGAKVERTREWDILCLWAPMLIAGLVGLARWRWTVAARTRRVDVRSCEKDLGHESGATIA